MLPFIGTGMVLMPLAFWQILNGYYTKAVICVILYVVCAVTREFLEPKLIGNDHDRKKTYNPCDILHIAYGLIHNLRHYLYLKILYKDIDPLQNKFLNPSSVHAEFLLHPVTAISHKQVKFLLK